MTRSSVPFAQQGAGIVGGSERLTESCRLSSLKAEPGRI
jgi:hypothetical protein